MGSDLWQSVSLGHSNMAKEMVIESGKCKYWFVWMHQPKDESLWLEWEWYWELSIVPWVEFAVHDGCLSISWKQKGSHMNYLTLLYWEAWTNMDVCFHMHFMASPPFSFILMSAIVLSFDSSFGIREGSENDRIWLKHHLSIRCLLWQV